MNQNLYTSTQIKKAELCWSEEHQRPTFKLMEKAAVELDWHIQKHWPNIRSVCICCGAGNNGGDGLLLATKLIQRDISVRILLNKSPSPESDAAIAFNLCQKASLKTESYDSLKDHPISESLIVDAIFGSGFTGNLKQEFMGIFEAINTSESPVLSVDVPSGVNANTGSLGLEHQFIRADHTLTFGGYKPGLVTGRPIEAVGQLFLADLDLLSCLHKQLPTAYWCSLPEHKVTTRQASVHKGNMGNVAVIGGSSDMGGAIILVAMASAAMGAGYVRCITHANNRTALLSHTPETLVSDWPVLDGILELQARGANPDSLVLGPGLGLSTESKNIYSQAVSFLIEHRTPSILDADALTLLAETPSFCAHWILTPHPKEAARLLGDCSVKEVEADRQWAVRSIQKRYGGVCVLKGAGSIIYGDDVCTINGSGNSGMARAGMGDVLSGMLGGLVARNPDKTLYQNACMGTWMHGKAGDLAMQNKHQESMQARHLIEALDQVWPLIKFT